MHQKNKYEDIKKQTLKTVKQENKVEYNRFKRDNTK